MDFPKDYHWKKRTTGPSPLFHLKNASHIQAPSANSLPNKGCVRIQQYQYQEQNLIGQGYTSKVYLGRTVQDYKSQFAIKVVDKRKISKNRQNMQLLRQQMDIHKQLDHPNIVKCIQIIERPHFYYFILEYCPHGTLDTFIKKHQRLTQSTTISIIEQIISAYKYLIQHKVLHRDLKPPNILKSGPNWKICDFGFSVIGKKNMVGNINVGTPAYMAPQALQRTYYSPKTDFFSLGVLCYQMLFGLTPWQHKNQKILLQMMQQQKLNQEHLGSISNKNLVLFITKCCEVIQRKRMTIQEFQQFSFWKESQIKVEPVKKKQQIKDDSFTQQLQKNEQRPASKTFTVFREIYAPSSTCPSVTSNYSNATSTKKQPIQVQFSGNTAVIQRQLYHAKLLFALMRNNHYFLFQQQEQKQLFFTVLGKHSTYMLRRIKHSKYNYLGLRKWQDYTSTDSYGQLFSEAQKLASVINQKMTSQVKRKSIVTIRVVNKRFDELTYDKHLTGRCIGNIKQYVSQLLIKTLCRYQKLGTNYIVQNKWTGQVLDILLKYHRYVIQLSNTTEESRTIASKHNFKDYQIQCPEDFKDSSLSYEDYLARKEQILALPRQ